jgi:alpha-glucosidase (family GH31 glycosyl hydrolase)
MEVGPTNNLGFWAMNYNPSFDHEILAIWRFYSKLRMSLVDYIYDQAIVASQTGMPVARPLYLDYPEQKECWENWTSYMLGNDLLVSVVWKDGKTLQEVYLPEGETWTDLWTNEEYKGGQTVEVNAPLHKIPVFMRKGSNLNLPVFNELYDESVKLTATQYNMNDLEVKEGWD